MSRSVNYDSNAEYVEFLNPELECFDDWEFFIEDIIREFTGAFPSLSEPAGKRWVNNETRVILENTFAEISVSEYGGIVSLSFSPKENHDRPQLAASWLWSIRGSAREILVPRGVLRKIGTASNGESFYERVG